MIELLAPAGGPDSIQAAVRCGADAVYLGGESFSARANAKNFSYEQLCEAVQYCHLHNVKVHQAVNTVVFDNELDKLVKTIKQSAEAGVDAVIVQDLGTAILIKQLVPDMIMHASTQMSIHTKEGAFFAKELGFSRVVASRELNIKQIEDICSVGIEVEVFVHGALCMCVSGQCYMSAMIGSRSANRGLCAQTCRLPFSAIDGQQRYDLSLKDMSLVNHIGELASAGVCSLKIEGRMKRAEYVASAVTACRQAIDGQIPDLETLRAVFSRSGFTDGYLNGKLGSDMFGIRQKEDVISADRVFPKLHELYRKERKCAAVNFHTVIKSNKPSELTAESEGITVCVKGDIPQAAFKSPITDETLRKQLSKLGDTVYNAGKITAEIDSGLMLTASQINTIRREAIAELDMARISKSKANYVIKDIQLPIFKKSETVPKRIRSQVRTAEQALICLESSKIEQVILPLSECRKIAADTRLTIAPPRFITDENKLQKELLELKEKGFTRLYCQNPAHIQIGKAFGFILYGGFGLNVTNSYSLKVLHDIGVEDTVVSFEMKLSQVSELADVMPFGVIAYGKLPLMLTRNCPIKQAVGSCKSCTGHITDRTGRIFPVVCDGDSSEILNCDVLQLSDRLDEIHGASFIQLFFTNESKKDIEHIIMRYLNGSKVDSKNFTRGLYYRGIL